MVLFHNIGKVVFLHAFVLLLFFTFLVFFPVEQYFSYGIWCLRDDINCCITASLSLALIDLYHGYFSHHRHNVT